MEDLFIVDSILFRKFISELEKRLGGSVYQDLAVTVEELRKVLEEF